MREKSLDHATLSRDMQGLNTQVSQHRMSQQVACGCYQSQRIFANGGSGFALPEKSIPFVTLILRKSENFSWRSIFFWGGGWGGPRNTALLDVVAHVDIRSLPSSRGPAAFEGWIAYTCEPPQFGNEIT